MDRPLVVLVDGDPALTDAIDFSLAIEGCDVRRVPPEGDPAAAARALGSVRLAIVDVAREGRDEASRWIERFAPIPVGVLVGSPDELSVEKPSFALDRPFDLELLLAHAAQAIAKPTSDADRARATKIHAWLDALATRRFDALEALCAEDVTYHAQRHDVVHGRAELRAYAERVFADFPLARFDEIEIGVLPGCLAASYRAQWVAPGGPATMRGALRFVFEGDRIREVGVSVDVDRLRALGHRL